MINEQERNIEYVALYTYGFEKQIDLMIEEMSELTKALLKLRRFDGNDTEYMKRHAHVCEEIADVEIMLDQMKICFGEGNVSEWKEDKLDRLRKRLLKIR